MSLPPERITVKRRRDEDPVEALYIQSKKQRSDIVWKLQIHSDDQHQPVQKQPPEVTTKDRSTPGNDGRLSSVLPQSPKDDGALAENRNPFLQRTSPGIPNESSDVSAAGGGAKAPSSSRIRRYHLTRDSFPSLNRQPSFAGGVKKSQKPQRSLLAVFVESERAEEVLQSAIRERHETSPEKLAAQRIQANADSTIRKRPNVNAAERAWRAETWGKQNDVSAETVSEIKNQPPSGWVAKSMQIAEELQHIALDHAQTAPQVSPTPALKFKPKSPGPRRPPDIASDGGRTSPSATHGKIDEDGDYIIDTYIRAPLQPNDADIRFGTDLAALDNMDTGKVGILVIEEDQEKLWEDFRDDDQSEIEFESDEEDENAEDFYGNDYPEDEADTDDEYGRGSYNYRTHASDDEEYGDDEPQWSDAEDGSHR